MLVKVVIGVFCCHFTIYLFQVCSQLTDKTELNLNGDCEYLPWFPWSACTANCSGGIKTRHRVINVSSLQNYGVNLTCQGAETDIATCNEHLCPIDCLLSEWTAWSPCNCTIEEKLRRRMVLQSSENEGVPCVESLDYAECFCPTDCEVSLWSDWNDCGATCGHSTAGRNRSIIVNQAKGGLQCPPLTDIVMCILPPCPDPASLCYGMTDGNYADPAQECSVNFISCTNQRTKWRKCPEDLIFDIGLQRCEKFENTKYCLRLHEGISAEDWKFRWSSLLAMVVILLLMIAFLVRVVLWDVPCC